MTSKLKQRIEEQNQIPTLAGALAEEYPMIILPGAQILADGMGLEINTDTPIEKWAKIAPFWGRLQDRTSFMLGDWLNFGEQMYGEMYSQAIDETGLRQETLRKAAWVAQKVEFVRRRTKLSFEHHAEVASLVAEEQTKWLEIAETERLSKRELRASIKAGKVVRASDESEEKDDESGEKEIPLEKWTEDGKTWIEQEIAKAPVEDWTSARKKLVRNKIQEIVDFYLTLSV